ncbi:BRO family protein [Phenylobacterium koreense]|uniref:DNA-damage-inducible protein D n=1 Tax=Phenylobacterium koreense TaxID=266125 RepID=A0ABV2EGM1_9CAUL
MTADLEVFHFEDDRPSFESLGRQNGFRYWLASDLMQMLDYSTMQPIHNAVNKAMAACAQLGIPISENFSETKTESGGKDCKLSRFACYLTVMNGDPKKPKVAQAQAYFITMAEAFRLHVQEAESIERVVIRGEVSDRETALSATVHARGIETIQFFQNAGYRGMYNLDLKQIRSKKGVPDGRSVLDFMGKTELAANLFRITQTEEKIRNEDITGQKPLERAAEHVGKGVRKTMIELSGVAPERLPPSEDIKKVKSALKRTGKEYAKLDAPRKK